MILSFKLIFGGRFLFLRSFLRDFEVREGSVFDGGSNKVADFSSFCSFSLGEALLTLEVV